MHAILIAGLTVFAVLSGGDSVVAQQAATITVDTPADGATVGRTFALSGTVSRGGGGLQLKIDGLSYLPPDLRTESGEVTEGVNFGETPAGATNVAFSEPVDLNGAAVVSGGGLDRRPVTTGTHRLQVCQALGPAAGCSPEVTVTVSDEVTATATTPPTNATLSPSANPAAVRTVVSLTDLLPVLAAALLGGLTGYGVYRLRQRR